MESIAGVYSGECKKGLAHGKGESKGVFKYVGNFRYGLPNGKGILYTGDHYFDGNFQDGLKEGKGEMHFTKPDKSDSIIKGYWSGNEFRGKSYKTYQTDAVSKFDRVEIASSTESGHKITIEVSTTTIGVSSDQLNQPRSTIALSDLISLKLPSLLKLVSTSASPLKSTWVFEISEFPTTLRGILTNGQDFKLELYKAVDWSLKIFINK
jgi:hypothetical protein